MVNINNRCIGKLGAFLDAGYALGEITYQRGYVSRKFDFDKEHRNLNVYIVDNGRGSGQRNGSLFVLLPNYNSTKYCYRCYLYKKLAVK